MKKKFDSVQLQRSIRAKLSKRFSRTPKAELIELEKKFGHLKQRKASLQFVA